MITAIVAPSRGRGLKHLVLYSLLQLLGRPFTGAWIETRHPQAGSRRPYVAPSRGRGLKLILLAEIHINSGRPFTGAWIET